MADEIAVQVVFHQIGVVVSALANRAYEVVDLDPQDQQTWLLNMGNMLLGLGNMGDFTTMSESQVLYTVWKCWEDLSVEVKKKWEGDFYKWAASFTKRRANKEPAKVTIDNKITVYRDWEAENVIEYPDTVYVPKRDVFGKAADPSLAGEDAWVSVPFDPSQIDFGKKLIARGTAKDGLMTAEAWTAMADPFATVEDLKTEIKAAKRRSGTEEETNKPDVVMRNGLDFTFFEQNGLLYVGMAGTVVAFARLLSENRDSPLARRAMEHMLSAIGVTQSTLEDTTDMEMPLVQIAGDGVIISKGSDRIGHFDRAEAQQIVNAIEEWLNIDDEEDVNECDDF
ncbi:hypothetical protein IMZ48_42405 [Candidatus Bathyarchaeota archaeon]|nr:hypothetical protein [Candidatus Bathyarchaeota archaeon]